MSRTNQGAQAPFRPRRILVVDDEEDMIEVLEESLENKRYSVASESSSARAAVRLREETFDLLLADLKMPPPDGLELLRIAREHTPSPRVILLTGFPTIQTAVRAIQEGAFDYVSKPFTPAQIRIVVDRALRLVDLEEENRSLRQRVRDGSGAGAMLGRSAVMEHLLRRIDRAAESDSSVLVLGETGTGKELVARTIHERSRRRAKPFVAVDCGAIPESLLESEFFGHEKGAFTGAAGSRPGLLEQAHGGTLFLDEVCELAPILQAKVLRALQEHTFRRVGGRKEIRVDLRVVAATNRPIEQEVAAGRFRQDLYFRLNVIRVDVPPLRERQGDIAILAMQFLRETIERDGGGPKRLTPAALEKLEGSPWPGNVRQLRNVVEQAVFLAEGDAIAPEHLPGTSGPGATSTENPPDLSIPFFEARSLRLERFERTYLAKLLEACGGNVSRAARLGGLPRGTLHRLLRKHDLDARPYRIETPVEWPPVSPHARGREGAAPR